MTVVRDDIERDQRRRCASGLHPRCADARGCATDAQRQVRSATVAGRALPPIGPWASGHSVFGSSEHQRMASRFSWNSTSARTTLCFASRTAPMMSVPCLVFHSRQTVVCSQNRGGSGDPGARPLNAGRGVDAVRDLSLRLIAPPRAERLQRRSWARAIRTRA